MLLHGGVFRAVDSVAVDDGVGVRVHVHVFVTGLHTIFELRLLQCRLPVCERKINVGIKIVVFSLVRVAVSDLFTVFV